MPRTPAALGVGLCGLGRHGERYARHLLAGEVASARLAAICRRDERSGLAFAERHGVRFHADATALAADTGVDAVVAVLPPDLHPAAAEAALDAGKPVLVEKPLAATVEGARRIAAAAARTGLLVMVAKTLRYSAVVAAMRPLVAALGPLRLLALSQRFEPTDRPWIDDPGRGGLMLNTGVHAVDLARWLSGGEFVEVFARAERVRTRATEDSFAAVARLEPGPLLFTLDNCRSTSGRTGRIEIVGERGQLAGDHVLGTLAEVTERGARAVPVGPRVATVRAALERFVGAVRKGEPSPIPPEEGLAALRVVEAMARSAATGRTCRIVALD